MPARVAPSKAARRSPPRLLLEQGFVDAARALAHHTAYNELRRVLVDRAAREQLGDGRRAAEDEQGSKERRGAAHREGAQVGETGRKLRDRDLGPEIYGWRATV